MPPKKDSAPPCSKPSALPGEVECPACGEACESWPDEPEVKCPACGKVFGKT